MSAAIKLSTYLCAMPPILYAFVSRFQLKNDKGLVLNSDWTCYGHGSRIFCTRRFARSKFQVTLDQIAPDQSLSLV